MKKDIVNISASIRARLQNKAAEAGRPFAEILQYFGMERFLFRLSRSKYADKFFLKGALLFTVWGVPNRRSTLDMDFLVLFDNKVASIETAVREICRVTVDPDGLIFDPETVQGHRIKEDADYEGVRVRFTGFLDRSKIHMQIDAGFGDAVYPRPKTIEYPTILSLPSPHLVGYPAESVVSEKFEAMIKLGLLNSRMKDFYDIWLMLRQFDFKGLDLSEALRKTFEHRKTVLPKRAPLFAEEIYDEMSDRQKLWRAFLIKGNIKHAPDKLVATAREIEKFLVKPLIALGKNLAFKEEWKAGAWICHPPLDFSANNEMI